MKLKKMVPVSNDMHSIGRTLENSFPWNDTLQKFIPWIMRQITPILEYLKEHRSEHDINDPEVALSSPTLSKLTVDKRKGKGVYI